VRSWFILALLLAACGPSLPVCGEGLDPTVVTGLNGVLEDGTPAVEVQLRVPADCTRLDTAWMFWDEASQTVNLGEEPTSGTLDRENVDVGDDVIYFSEIALGVRLHYPDGVVGPNVAFEWFAPSATLATVDCAREEETLSCALRTE
jgi:hypothetical protein